MVSEVRILKNHNRNSFTYFLIATQACVQKVPDGNKLNFVIKINQLKTLIHVTLHFFYCIKSGNIILF